MNTIRCLLVLFMLQSPTYGADLKTSSKCSYDATNKILVSSGRNQKPYGVRESTYFEGRRIDLSKECSRYCVVEFSFGKIDNFTKATKRAKRFFQKAQFSNCSILLKLASLSEIQTMLNNVIKAASTARKDTFFCFEENESKCKRHIIVSQRNDIYSIQLSDSEIRE